MFAGLLLFTACGSKEGQKAEEPKAEEPKAAEETVKIGYLAALTGDWAAYGQTEEDDDNVIQAAACCLGKSGCLSTLFQKISEEQHS